MLGLGGQKGEHNPLLKLLQAAIISLCTILSLSFSCDVYVDVDTCLLQCALETVSRWYDMQARWLETAARFGASEIPGVSVCVARPPCKGQIVTVILQCQLEAEYVLIIIIDEMRRSSMYAIVNGMEGQLQGLSMSLIRLRCEPPHANSPTQHTI